MESNACARLRWRPIVRFRNTVVTGFVGGPAGGCCAARLAGTTANSASKTACARFIRSSKSGGRRKRDSGRRRAFPQLCPGYLPVYRRLLRRAVALTGHLLRRAGRGELRQITAAQRHVDRPDALLEIVTR